MEFRVMPHKISREGSLINFRSIVPRGRSVPAVIIDFHMPISKCNNEGCPIRCG